MHIEFEFHGYQIQATPKSEFFQQVKNGGFNEDGLIIRENGEIIAEIDWLGEALVVRSFRPIRIADKSIMIV